MVSIEDNLNPKKVHFKEIFVLINLRPNFFSSGLILFWAELAEDPFMTWQQWSLSVKAPPPCLLFSGTAHVEKTK